MAEPWTCACGADNPGHRTTCYRCARPQAPVATVWTCGACENTNPATLATCVACGASSDLPPAKPAPVLREGFKVGGVAAAAVGAAACFMPWARAGIFTVSGVDGDGAFVLAAFLAAGVMLLAGKRATSAWLAVLAFGGGGWLAADVVGRFEDDVLAAGGVLAALSGAIGMVCAIGRGRNLDRVEKWEQETA